jgi:hypothetical protein
VPTKGLPYLPDADDQAPERPPTLEEVRHEWWTGPDAHQLYWGNAHMDATAKGPDWYGNPFMATQTGGHELAELKPADDGGRRAKRLADCWARLRKDSARSVIGRVKKRTLTLPLDYLGQGEEGTEDIPGPGYLLQILQFRLDPDTTQALLDEQARGPARRRRRRILAAMSGLITAETTTPRARRPRSPF